MLHYRPIFSDSHGNLKMACLASTEVNYLLGGVFKALGHPHFKGNTIIVYGENATSPNVMTLSYGHVYRRDTSVLWF